MNPALEDAFVALVKVLARDHELRVADVTKEFERSITEYHQGVIQDDPYDTHAKRILTKLLRK